LTKSIIKERKIDASLDAVISAIRRYEPDCYDKIFENARKVICRTTALSTRSPLANIALTKDAEVQKLLPKLFSMIHYKQGDVLRIIHADEAIKYQYIYIPYCIIYISRQNFKLTDGN